MAIDRKSNINLGIIRMSFIEEQLQRPMPGNRICTTVKPDAAINPVPQYYYEMLIHDTRRLGEAQRLGFALYLPVQTRRRR